MSFQVSEEDGRDKIVELLENIGCCKLCTLRYIGLNEPMSYRRVHDDPSHYYQLLKKSLNEEGNSPKSKVSKENTCIACLGLLQELPEMLSEIAFKIKNCNIQALSYYPTISIPISLTIRAYSIWFHLSELLPNVYTKDFLKPEGLSIKSVWKWISIPVLKEKFDPLSDWNANGNLEINIDFIYKDDKLECEQMLTYLKHCKSNNMKKGGCHFSKTTATYALNLFKTAENFKKSFQCPPSIPTISLQLENIICIHNPIFVAGRYCKYSRELSQTPWIIDGERKTESSVEELISTKIIHLFGAEKSKFSSSGREDVDVRNIGLGRPFVIEIANPKRTAFLKERMRKLQNEINNDTKLISIRDLQIVDKKDLANLKEGEESKTKTYLALCYTPKNVITQEDLDALSKVKLPLVLQQKTPIRVFHRRTALTRERSILAMEASLVESPNFKECSFFKLKLKTQAGTYVKEFVHGDFGRTSPSISDLLGVEADILLLDVTEVDVKWPPLLD